MGDPVSWLQVRRSRRGRLVVATLVRDIPDYPSRASRSATSRRCSATPRRSAGPSTSSPTASPTTRRRPGRRRRGAGFILAAPSPTASAPAFVPVRKAGKLPWAVVREEYELEYGTDKLEIHRDAIHPDERILVIDDVLATGGTAAATARLVEALGGAIVGIGFLIEIADLGRPRRARRLRRVEILARY